MWRVLSNEGARPVGESADVGPKVTKKEKALAVAKKALERGNLERALGEYKKALAEDAKDARSWLRLAELQVKMAKRADAAASYFEAAGLYTDQGFFQRAVAVYKNVLKLSPDLVEANLKLADLFRQLGLLSDAIQQLEQAARTHRRAGRMEQALSAMRRIVDLNPDHVVSRLKLAETAARAGLTNEAIIEFRKAADHLKSLGKQDEFLRVGERLLALKEDDLDLAREMSEIYIERGNARFALARLQPCFNKNPRHIPTLQLLARAFEQLGQVAKTVSVLKELARLHRDEGRAADSIAAYQRVLVLDPSDPEARNESVRAHRQSVSSAAPAPPVNSGPATSPGPAIKRPASITFSEMAVPQFLLSSEGSSQGLALTTSTELQAVGNGPQALTPEQSAEVSRILSECDVFIKYELLERAVEHLQRIFEIDAHHVDAREQLARALLKLGRAEEASRNFALLSEQLRHADPARSSAFAEEALSARPRPTSGASASGVIGAGYLETGEIENMDVGLRAGEVVSGELVGVSREDAGGPDDVVLEFEEVDSDYLDDEADKTPTEFTGFEQDEPTHADPAGVDPADLEQIDFFLNAGMPEEAAELIDELAQQCPGFAGLVERRERLAEIQGAVPVGPDGGSQTQVPVVATAALGASSSEEEGRAHLEAGHLDAALSAFARMAGQSDTEVQGLYWMGYTCAKMGSLAEAVIHFKKALNKPAITENETTRLYNALGEVFELLGEPKEALYFFEKVKRRDPHFDNVGLRIERLKQTG